MGLEINLADWAQAFERLLPRIVKDLSVLPSPWRERELEAALQQACDVSDARLWSSTARQFTVRPDGWAGHVGPVDLALVDASGEPVALVEVKLGGDALWNCAWDLAKLSLCAAEEIAPLGVLVAAARSPDWARRARGAEIFEMRAWRLDTFLARYARDFAFWAVQVQNRPLKLPAQWQTFPLATQPMEVDGEEWELRAVALETVDPVRVPVVYAPMVAAPQQSDEGDPGGLGAGREVPRIEPLSVSVDDVREELSQDQLDSPLIAADGMDVGAVDLSGVAIGDEKQRRSGREPSGHQTPSEMLWFGSPSQRRAYVEQRGWRPAGSQLPDTFLVSGGSGLGANFAVRWNGQALEYDSSGVEADAVPRLETLSPSQDRWRAFWTALDRLDAWAWRHRYEPLGLVTDGYGWAVRIAYVGRICDSSGYMAFPHGTNWPDTSATWDAFLLEVSDLLGGAPTF